ncbi:MAG TPA: S8 family peptidase [Kofleriaceae bacterium]|nr:S8 family peptidase [Kofleriaceae bacterium]
MRRIADVPTVLRYLSIALLLLAIILFWRMCREPARTSQAIRLAPIHIKYRPGMVRYQTMAHAYTVRPLFRHAHQSVAAYDDPRDRWVRIEVDTRYTKQILAQLANDPAVETAFVPPTVTLPRRPVVQADDESCPIHTPSFESYQGYLGPAPHGIDAPAAWRRGVRGQGIWFADIEGGWNSKHEDLPGDRISHVAGEPINDIHWRAHGTAVLGEVVGRDNGKGVVGIAPDVERVFTSSIGGIPTAEALDAAAEQLRAGDVLLIELQGAGPRGRYLPMEYWDDNFDAIEAATSRGVLVIEAAGNGGENLDHKIYKGKLSRSGRDSGAIMVGAGGPPRDGFDDRERLDFSNYGTRVDVQGWGRMVATLDYGDLQNCAGTERSYRDRHYTNEFSGTSSASPIVAGAAVLIESYAKQQGRVLSPTEVRDILSHTGTPQAGDTTQNIGPRPDLARALLRVQRYADQLAL